jgi:GT2 family glycosyltransferase
VSRSTTILVLSVDEADWLEVSLPAAVVQPGAEVVVIDNACTDRTRSVCEALGVRVVGLRERRTYAAAINAGLAATSGEAVLLLNADCVLDPGFLEGARARAAEVFGGDGACVLYRREVLDACAIGGEVLDEDLELWASDADLAWRARTLGWRCAYEPAAVGWHKRFYSPSTRAALPAAHRRLQFRNRLLMVVKNETGRGLARDLPRILAWEVLALGYAVLRERELLGAYVEAARLLRRARERRAVLRERRGGRPAVTPPFGLEAPRT